MGATADKTQQCRDGGGTSCAIEGSIEAGISRYDVPAREADPVKIPDYQALMLPLLEGLADGREHLVRDVRESIARRFGLVTAEREALLPSGKQPIFDNRLGWAKTYLGKAGLVATVRRGVYQITDRVRSVVASKPGRIDAAYLAKFPEFEEFRGKADDEDEPSEGGSTPKAEGGSPAVLAGGGAAAGLAIAAVIGPTNASARSTSA